MIILGTWRCQEQIIWWQSRGYRQAQCTVNCTICTWPLRPWPNYLPQRFPYKWSGTVDSTFARHKADIWSHLKAVAFVYGGRTQSSQDTRWYNEQVFGGSKAEHFKKRGNMWHPSWSAEAKSIASHSCDSTKAKWYIRLLQYDERRRDLRHSRPAESDNS